MALGIAPQGGQTAHAHHGGGQGADTGGGLAVVHHPGQGIRPEEHHQKGDEPQGEKQHQSQAEGPPDLVAPVQGVGLADQLGHGHGQARRGHGEQHGVDVIGVVEVGSPRLPDDVDEGDLIEHADELDDEDAGG